MALLYVGVSLSALHRLGQHRDHAHWYAKIKRVEIEQFQTRKEALAAEKAAIQREGPLYNVKRYSPPRDERRGAKESKDDLIDRIVRFNPIYSVEQAAKFLGLRPRYVKNAIARGDLSSIELPPARAGLNPRGYPYQPKTMITGWQLIDFIETLESRATRANGRGSR
jgi:hypothetical protein